MKIVYIPSWYPAELNSLEGIFIKEQVGLLAPNLGHCSVLYQINSKTTLRRNLVRYFEDGFSTYIIKAPYIPKINKPLFIQWCRNYKWLMEKFIKENQKPDLLHGHGYLAGLVCAQLSKSFGIPFCITIHDTSLVRAQLKSWRYDLLIESFRTAAAIISVSKFLKNELNALTGFENIRIIPNPVHPRFLDTPIRNSEEKVFTFCIIGSLDKRKRVDLAIDSLNYLIKKHGAEAQLWIIGDGEERETIEDRISEYRLANRVQMFGWVYREDLPEFISAADCIMSVSELETFGISLIEGLAMGKVLLATDSGGSREILSENNGILLRSDKAGDIGNAMKFILDQKKRFVSSDLRDEAKRNFSHMAINEKILETYRSVL